MTDRELTEILEEFPKYYTERTKIKFIAKDYLKIRQRIEKYFSKKDYKIKKTGDVTGGLKILIDQDSFLWFRASKTEAGVFRILADAKNKKKAKKLLSLGAKLI